MSWENSKTTDIMFAARKEVLSARSVIDAMLDAKDPIGCYRQGVDRYGEPLPEDWEGFTLIQMLDMLSWKLTRANSAMLEVSRRIGDMESELDSLWKIEPEDG